jgi:hypothetical protein
MPCSLSIDEFTEYPCLLYLLVEIKVDAFSVKISVEVTNGFLGRSGVEISKPTVLAFNKIKFSPPLPEFIPNSIEEHTPVFLAEQTVDIFSLDL